MHTRKPVPHKLLGSLVLLLISAVLLVSTAQAQLVADHNAVAGYDSIPTSYYSQIVENYTIFYGHTSHGSQIMTGLDMLEHTQPYFREMGDDLGHNGDTSWVQPTRDWLDSHSEYNMVMWSWCGGVNDNSEEGINTYLSSMNQLEAEYPGVTFIYMTGHLEGTGETGNLRTRNQQIRDYCHANNKVLFDFEDIESWDPDGNYYADGNDDCGWCTDWCSTHSCPSCDSCAHSHCYNCYVKGKAWWWMMARLAGWNGSDGQTYELSVTKSGTGSGTVSSTPSGINCGSSCSEDFSSGTSVSLTAAASSGSYFVGWSGAGCSGTGTCTVAVSSAATANAQFDSVNPDVTSHPVDKKVVAGQPVEYHCAASGPNLSYQWQRNGTNISGATSSTYEISQVGASQDGERYRCYVSNEYNNDTSNSAVLQVGNKPVYALWNGYLNMLNILELVNTSSSGIAADALFYNIGGVQASQETVSVAAKEQSDLVLNNMSGFSADSYGIVELDYSGSDLDGRLSFYRYAEDGVSYEFAFAVPLVSALTGTTAVGFNTMQPSYNASEAGDVVAQWLSVVNLDSEATRSFTVARYNESGTLLTSSEISVPPLQRVDIEGGHEDPGPSRVGLNVITPASTSAPYLAHLVRYGQKGPGYAFAFPLLASAGSGYEQWVPISNGGGGDNWLELLNCSSVAATLAVQFYDNLGTAVREDTVTLAPYAQQHIYASGALSEGMTGGARILPGSASDRINAQSMFYFRDSLGSIESMYGSQAKLLGSNEQYGTYNLNLGMYNWMRIFNASNASKQIDFTVYGSSTSDHSVTLGAHSGTDLGLHQTETYGTAQNSFGLVETRGSALIEILRLRPTASGGTDFAAPTAVR